jgi:hypothetical protein
MRALLTPLSQASALVLDVLAAAEQSALHWRYRCIAECALCMLLPLLDGESGAAVARHWAGERRRPAAAARPPLPRFSLGPVR